MLLAVAAAMRLGEILAACWCKVDRDLGTLLIDRALERTKVGGGVFKEPKSRTGTVALPPLVIEAINELRGSQITAIEMLGPEGYEQNDLICFLPDGSLRKPFAFTSAYRALLARRDLKGPNFHALRGSHASHRRGLMWT